MSNASAGPLLAACASYVSGGAPAAEAEEEMGYRDHPAWRAASASASYSYYSASGTSASASASGSGSIACTVSSAGYLGTAAGSSSLTTAASLARPTRREKAVPMREEVSTPAPPAYSKS
ncbi:hypothetical protein B0H14DRAFT_3444174 [Mycena olivaceomarginata]|nr:hypothetical protein B0H14DRAFT_3444174 [Mycena olivaceomarginata]